MSIDDKIVMKYFKENEIEFTEEKAAKLKKTAVFAFLRIHHYADQLKIEVSKEFLRIKNK